MDTFEQTGVLPADVWLTVKEAASEGYELFTFTQPGDGTVTIRAVKGLVNPVV